MKQITKRDIVHMLQDRWWVGLVVANVLVAIIVVAILGFSIDPKETQVITHYSSFGVTGFYRSYWYALWGYVLLELIILLTHGMLSIKLQHLKRRDLALALLWATLGLSGMVLVYGLSIIKIAALG